MNDLPSVFGAIAGVRLPTLAPSASVAVLARVCDRRTERSARLGTTVLHLLSTLTLDLRSSLIADWLGFHQMRGPKELKPHLFKHQCKACYDRV